jgi:hypothetical protein
MKEIIIIWLKNSVDLQSTCHKCRKTKQILWTAIWNQGSVAAGQDHFYSPSLLIPNGFKQSLTTLYLAPRILLQAQKCIVPNTCSIARRFLNDADRLLTWWLGWKFLTMVFYWLDLSNMFPRFSLFWDVTQRRLVVTLKDETDRLSRNVGNYQSQQIPRFHTHISKSPDIPCKQVLGQMNLYSGHSATLSIAWTALNNNNNNIHFCYGLYWHSSWVLCCTSSWMCWFIACCECL